MTIFLLILAFIFVGAGLTWFLLAHDDGPKEPVGILWLAAGLGALGAIAAYYLEIKLIPASDLVATAGTPMASILVGSLAIGLIEEACKFVPIAIFLYKKPYFNEVTDGIIYFAIAGLGFGVPENILYTLNYGSKIGLYRILLTPIFHAATTGMVGYFYAKSKVEKRSLAIALVGAMLIHGFYDFGLSSGIFGLSVISIAITLATSTFLFILFLRAREIDVDLGLNEIALPKFCEHCGFPNTSGKKYCTHCGEYVLIGLNQKTIKS
jgi:RsiW-degrading membrane proteinase PrsW (M82 family)